MPLLPYCVFLAAPSEVPTAGVENRVVRHLDLAGLSVIYSDLETNEIAGDKFQPAALKFHEVIDRVFQQRAVIPFRFPTFLSEVTLRDHLEKDSEQYLNFLRAHAEHVQMEIRIWRAEVPGPVRSSRDDAKSAAPSKPIGGTEYMKRLLELQMPLQLAAREVQRISEPLVHEWKTDEGRDWIRVFALVPRKHVDDLRHRLSPSLVEPRRTHMRVTGPWPATQFFARSSTPIPHNVLSITRGENS